MVFILLIAVIAISIALGFALKRKVPKLHIIMCLLISFAITLTIAAAMLRAFGP